MALLSFKATMELLLSSLKLHQLIFLHHRMEIVVVGETHKRGASYEISKSQLLVKQLAMRKSNTLMRLLQAVCATVPGR